MPSTHSKSKRQKTRILQGDCLKVLKTIPANSVHAIVTDPPYGLKFMAKKWDTSVPPVVIWKECLRVLKPGGHLLAFAGTRTQHRMASNIEDAGFEIRDMIAWVYGSGFPKSHDISKAIDREAGYKRGTNPDFRNGENTNPVSKGTEKFGGYKKTGIPDSDKGPITDAAIRWEGYGTALKPALEPITLARKPFTGTIAANVIKHGCGCLNIDACRVRGVPRTTHKDGNRVTSISDGVYLGGKKPHGPTKAPPGRWPANFIHDGSTDVVDLFPQSKSTGGINYGQLRNIVYGGFQVNNPGENAGGLLDSGSASRFFYCAKASKKDRDDGLHEFPETESTSYGTFEGTINHSPKGKHTLRRNDHPTVKPVKLMSYLVKLVTPPGGTILDPFMGSGSTGKAAALESRPFIGIEIDPAYCAIARARIAAAKP